jgi:hypothetical protein
MRMNKSCILDLEVWSLNQSSLPLFSCSSTRAPRFRISCAFALFSRTQKRIYHRFFGVSTLLGPIFLLSENFVCLAQPYRLSLLLSGTVLYSPHKARTV